jgi:hypothetical protein
VGRVWLAGWGWLAGWLAGVGSGARGAGWLARVDASGAPRGKGASDIQYIHRYRAIGRTGTPRGVTQDHIPAPDLASPNPGPAFPQGVTWFEGAWPSPDCMERFLAAPRGYALPCRARRPPPFIRWGGKNGPPAPRRALHTIK